MRISPKYILIQTVILIVIFTMGELRLRWQGYTPGDLRPSWSNFHPVDSLVVYPDFIMDSTGILIGNVERLRAAGLAINSNGFRTSEFRDMDTARHKILLIGDSYTWGLSAQPLDSCFADQLKNKLDATIINLGIPSTDPAQYDALARRYVPLLKPEKVVVMFYLGNDIMAKPRAIVPFRPFYYYTNAGAMMADDGDIHLSSAREAYEYYTHQKFFLLHPAGLLEQVISRSALLSRIYSVKYRWAEKHAVDGAITDMSVTQRYLYSIVDICRSHHCQLQVILIPEMKEADQPRAFFEKKYKGFFGDSILSKYSYIPAGNSSRYYVSYPDGHLNNAGHSFYAEKIAERMGQLK